MDGLSLVLVGGPSGVGKSRLAQALALDIGSTVAQVDDLHTAIESLVPPDRLPEYFVPATTYLRTDDVEEISRAAEHIARWFDPAVRAVITNRIESGTSTVFEGDFISPEAAAEARSLGVRSVFLLGSEDDVRANYLQRDGDEQVGRARVSALVSERLADRCRELGLPALGARPFDTLLGRTLDALVRGHMTDRAHPGVDAYIAQLPEWQQEICTELRELIWATDPEIEETIKRTVQPYFVLQGNVCALLATKDHVNLFLYDPTVTDPHGIINQGHGNATGRAVQIYADDEIDRDAVVGILSEIVDHNRRGGWRKL